MLDSPPANPENVEAVAKTHVTVTEPLLVPPTDAPPKRRRTPTKKKTSSRKSSTRIQPVAPLNPSTPVDLFDAIDFRLHQARVQLRENIINGVVVMGIILLIVLAHWATQPEIATAPVATPVVVDVTTVEPIATSETPPASEEQPPDETAPPEGTATTAIVAETPLTATAAVTEASRATTPPASPPATPPETTPLPTATGMVIESSVSIRATLDPTKPPPTAVEPTPPAAELAPLPVIKRMRMVRRRQATARAEPVPLVNVNDPYTNGGPLDLDNPTARQHYLQQNQKILSATRTE